MTCDKLYTHNNCSNLVFTASAPVVLFLKDFSKVLKARNIECSSGLLSDLISKMETLICASERPKSIEVWFVLIFSCTFATDFIYT